MDNGLESHEVHFRSLTDGIDTKTPKAAPVVPVTMTTMVTIMMVKLGNKRPPLTL